MKFEVVSRFKDCGIRLPERATGAAAGYDFFVAEDIILPSFESGREGAYLAWKFSGETLFHSAATLDEAAAAFKKTGYKPVLVSSGVKCQLENDKFLQISVRSSCPLKYWIILANGVGIIDADYYNNPDNEGEIFFQVINLSPFDIQLKKGDRIGQGIILPYYKTDDDSTIAAREGGFGSTG